MTHRVVKICQYCGREFSAVQHEWDAAERQATSELGSHIRYSCDQTPRAIQERAERRQRHDHRHYHSHSSYEGDGSGCGVLIMISLVIAILRFIFDLLVVNTTTALIAWIVTLLIGLNYIYQKQQSFTLSLKSSLVYVPLAAWLYLILSYTAIFRGHTNDLEPYRGENDQNYDVQKIIYEKQRANQNKQSWSCLCYTERVRGVPQQSTACRQSLQSCRKLYRAIQRGSKILVKGSANECREVFGDYPWTGTESTKLAWKPSKSTGNWWSPEGCHLR